MKNMKISTIIVAALPLAVSSLESATFSYKPDSDKAPNAWASLDLGPTVDNQCGGAAQSGIDVPASSCDTTGDYIFAPGTCTLDDIVFSVNDHTILATYNNEESGCTLPRMTIPGKPVPYDAIQFHMHTGSDHALNGRYFGADLHVVHKEVGGDGLSVLGLFLEPTDADGGKVFSDLLTEWEKVPVETDLACAKALNGTGVVATNATAEQSGGMRRRTAQGDEGARKLAQAFNPYALLPEGATMYTYQGSLTTPPCLEIVFWNVVDTAVSISPREFLRLTTLIIDYVNPETCELASVAADSGFTGRPVQNINGREINRICPTDFVDPLAETSASVEEADTAPTTAPAKSSATVAGSAMAGFAVAVLAAML